jgi:hypothetical protein
MMNSPRKFKLFCLGLIALLLAISREFPQIFGLDYVADFSPVAATNKISNAMQTVPSLSQVDLESILLKPDDLPAAYSGETITYIVPKAYKKLPKAMKYIDQRFKKDKEVKGGVTIFLYDTTENAERAYSALTKTSGKPESSEFTSNDSKPIPDIGEKGTIGYFKIVIQAVGHYFISWDIVFIRCHTVVSIRLDDAFHIVSYAKKLDQRLQGLVCN